jgi:glycosyltransferase involved in cell wall biosynthesis
MTQVESTSYIGNGLKILAFFIHRYRWGEQIRGDERGFLEKASRFKKLGAVLYTLEQEPSLQEHLNEPIYVSLKIHLKHRIYNSYFGKIIKLAHLTLAALRLASKIDYNVIYAYNQDMENVIPAYILKLVSRRPLVIIFHLIYPNDMLPFKKALRLRLDKGFSIPAALMASALDAVKRRAYSAADLHMSVSQAVKKNLIQHLKIRKVIVVQNGVDSGKFKPYNLEKIYDAAFLGRLHPQKGIETLLRAWKLVKARNYGAKLILIGGGDKEYVKNYRNLIRELELEENVELAGFVSDIELVKLLNSSKTFVFPTRYDGFALSVAEAMACGLPCVISDIPALKENYGEAAVLVKPNDVTGFAVAITRLLEDKEMLESMGKKAREHIKKFNWEHVIKRELEAFNDLKKLKKQKGEETLKRPSYKQRLLDGSLEY